MTTINSTVSVCVLQVSLVHYTTALCCRFYHFILMHNIKLKQSNQLACKSVALNREAMYKLWYKHPAASYTLQNIISHRRNRETNGLSSYLSLLKEYFHLPACC